MRLVILGAGGYGCTVVDVAEQSGKYEEILFLDDMSKLAAGKCTDYAKYKEFERYHAFGSSRGKYRY